jgi:type VI secretion system protein ImpL
MTSGRYPFQATSTNDVTLADFGRLFGYGGIFDTFFTANLDRLVDRSRRPWTWRSGVNLPSEMLRTFETAQDIRELFFRPGSQTAGTRFTVLLTGYDPSVARFVLDIEGQSIDSRNQQRSYSFTWPGPAAQLVSLKIDQRFGDSRTSPPYQGPWAWFRFFDASSPRRESANRFVLTAKAGDLQGQLLVEAISVNNPFSSDQWRQLSCEP